MAFNLADVQGAPTTQGGAKGFTLAELRDEEKAIAMKGKGSPPNKPTFMDKTLSASKDLLVGAVDWPLQLLTHAGGNIAGGIYAGLHPNEGISAKEIMQNSAAWSEAHDPIPMWAEKGYKAVHGKASVNNPVSQTFEAIGGLVHTIGQHFEKETNGAVPPAAFSEFVNALMLKVPGLTAKTAMHLTRRLLMRRMTAGAAGAEEEINAAADKYSTGTGEGKVTSGGVKKTPVPTNEEIQEVKDTLAKRRAAQQKAYDLMQRGAGKREVESALAKDKSGMLAEELDKIRAIRANAAEQFDKDFGARQGEWLPPEGTQGAAAPDGGRTAIGQETAQPSMQPGEGHPRLPGPSEGHPQLPPPFPRLPAPPEGPAAPKLLQKLHGVAEDLKERPAGEAPVPSPTLKELTQDGRYTTQLLSRLPQNRTHFGKTELQNELNRPDVSGSEKDIFRHLIDSTPAGGKIPASALATLLHENEKLHQLTPVESAQYAAYGTSNLGSRWSYEEEPHDHTTTVWTTPVETGDANHFKNPNYFAHTRSFMLGGERHIIEIQSDVAQHTKELSEESYKNTAAALDAVEKKRAALERISQRARGFYLASQLREGADAYVQKEIAHLYPTLAEAFSDDPEMGAWYKTQMHVNDLKRREAELRSKLNAGKAATQLQPLLKHWYRRVIREELARAKEAHVRFADADTVAKVEGWPKQLDANGEPVSGKFAEKEHEGIYKRYKKGIESYLRGLGGEFVKDGNDNGWYSVPTKNFAGKPVKMYGKVDPSLIIPLGLAAGGATTALALANKDKLEAAIEGGLAGAALALAPRYVENLRDDWRSTLRATAATAALGAVAAPMIHKHPVEAALLAGLYGGLKMLPKAVIPHIGDMSIDDHVNMLRGNIRVRDRETARVSRVLELAVPNAARRVELAKIIEDGKAGGLTGHEAKFAQIFRGYMDSYGDAAKDAGVIRDVVQNYVTHVVEKVGQPMSKVDEVLQAVFGETPAVGGASTRSGFGLRRKYATFSELQNALEGSGLQVKTMDPAEIVALYGKSMGRAIENKRFVTNLQVAKEGPGKGASALIMDAKRAPPSYVTISSPHLRGMAVHPDLEDSLRFVLESYRPSPIGRDILALTMMQKRLWTGLSFFHAQNLALAYAGASGMGETVKWLGQDAARILGRDNPSAVAAALEHYHRGEVGDMTDILLHHGLEIGSHLPTEFDPQALTKLGGVIDSFLPQAFGQKYAPAARTLGGLEKLQQQTFDKVTWDYLYTGMKLAVAHRELAKAYAKARGTGEITPEAERALLNKLAPQVVSFVNDTFGGLDWYRVATETQSAWLRKRALHLFSPRGRMAMQPLIFAMDWTLSTFRAAYKALPGASKMPLTAALHQKYVLRSALIYMTLMNGLNMATSGHPIWDNKNPFMLEYRDGTTQQIAKHAMEFPEWVRNPIGTAQNKLGFAPRTILQQAEMPKGTTTKQRVKAVLEGLAPMNVTAALEADSPGSAGRKMVGNTFGVSTYGKTSREKLIEKLRKELGK